MAMRKQDQINSLKFIDFDNLPPPAIMQKLEDINTELAHKVLDRAEHFQRHRADLRQYVAEMSVGHQLQKCFASVAGFVREKLHMAPKQNGNIRGNEDGFMFDSKEMATDIRQAIRTVMIDHYVSLSKLTPQEQNSLKISP